MKKRHTEIKQHKYHNDPNKKAVRFDNSKNEVMTIKKTQGQEDNFSNQQTDIVEDYCDDNTIFTN